MNSQQKKKAFTLTELLVVVIVIGVLSAVVLPKYSKVMETRKTTEAEELMAAVRTEQEKRCALDENYLSNLSDLSSIIPSTNTKNFAYTGTPTGMEAQSKGKYGYTLKMPSYADGRLCCENAEECSKLNKDYPLCSDLIARADYQSGSECAGVPPVIECSGSATQACGCLNKGTQTRTCDTTTGTWSAWSACSISDVCDCTQISGPQPSPETQACNGCGTQTRSYTCNTSTGAWVAGGWSACSKEESDCYNSCMDYCVSVPYAICNPYNNQLEKPKKNGVIEPGRYLFVRNTKEFYIDDPKECVFCDGGGQLICPDLQDLNGNKVGGFDSSICYCRDCPVGTKKKGKVCMPDFKPVKKDAVYGISIRGGISVPIYGPIYWYDGGEKSVEGGGKVTVINYKKRYGTDLPGCPSNIDSLCSSCSGSYCSNACHVENFLAEQIQITKKYSQCGGLSFESSDGKCALGQVGTSQIYVCE